MNFCGKVVLPQSENTTEPSIVINDCASCSSAEDKEKTAETRSVPKTWSAPSASSDDVVVEIVQVGKDERKTPVEDKYLSDLENITKQICALTQIQETGLFVTNEMKQNLKDLRKEEKRINGLIKNLRSDRKRQTKSRLKRKHALEKLREIPGAVSVLGPSAPKSGRPSLESAQSGLTSAILDIVSRNCNADERRRCETLLSNMKLKDLVAELKQIGFVISRQGLSLRFKPRCKSSTWGKRHVATVNVKLAKPTNSLRKDHVDSHFTAGTIKYFYDLAELFGSQNVMTISVDDKAKVPLGIAAAKLQGPILMRMDYEVRLPDHDFPVGTGHKLTPSVIAGLCADDRGKISYSGPTLISIHSGNNDSSTAETHADDLDRFVTLSSFGYFTRSLENVKPIWIILTDGGPDENPRYPKTLVQAIRHFKKYNLDALFIATNAPGHSAHNPVERKMAPLSRDLCSVILPYQHFGSHLNASGKTINKELEIKNFDKAGHVLANIWNNKIIDGHGVVAEYVHPPTHRNCLNEISFAESCSDLDGTDSIEFIDEAIIDEVIIPPREFNVQSPTTDVSEEWKIIHVRQSQYCLQITKCHKTSCCAAPKTKILRFLPEKFLPAPIPYTTGSQRPEIAAISTGHYIGLTTRLSLDFLPVPQASKPLPFDWFCPSISKMVSSRVCSICGIYFPSKVALKSHSAYHVTNSAQRIFLEVDETIDNAIALDDEDEITIIDNMCDVSSYLD